MTQHKPLSVCLCLLFAGCLFVFSVPAAQALRLEKTLYGRISPKSIVHSGKGLFFAQNMMYRHTITVYDRNFKLRKTIPDTIYPEKLGYPQFKGRHRGSPVEAAFSHQGRYAWVSNYKIFGRYFPRAARDSCRASQRLNPSFVYRINTKTLEIDGIALVGAVPKYLAVTPDQKRLLVTNWCSYDLSIVDTAKVREIKRVKLGAHPRGIAITPDGKKAYVAIMGSSHLAVVDLQTYHVTWLKRLGRGPRHLEMDPKGRYLYITFNGAQRVGKLDLTTHKLVALVRTGVAPRSMILAPNGKDLFVVNYISQTMSHLRTTDMKVLAKIRTEPRPIGITYDPKAKRVWVACYRGAIQIFSHRHGP
ncbi:MAG: YncE family protein [Myxococcales bacterium]|nr:YncE family protein [Myxococcales bacterium]